MLATLALAAALTVTPAQAGELKLTNVRMTIGELGPARPNAKILPGDILFIGYDINGLPIDPDGVVKYKMSMEVMDAAGKSIFKQEPRELNDYIPLRGNTIPARAFVTIGLDQDPGNYVCKVTVEDPKTKAKDTLETKFEVLKREYRHRRASTPRTTIAGQISAPTTGFVGQTIFINFSVVELPARPQDQAAQRRLRVPDPRRQGNPDARQARNRTPRTTSP